MRVKGAGEGSEPSRPEPAKKISRELKTSRDHVADFVQTKMVYSGKTKIKHPKVGPINATARKTNKYVQS